MSTNSRIEWTEQTWNPTIGCTKISPGCKNCYAETMAKRLRAMGMHGYENGFRLALMPERLMEPLRRRKATTYFVNSMSDLFHERVPVEYLRQVFDVMSRAPQHTFQVLTKRAERMATVCGDLRIPRNVWLGVSVENRRHGVPRIDLLRDIDASVRFLSIEPLLEDLGPLNLAGNALGHCGRRIRAKGSAYEAGMGGWHQRPVRGRQRCVLLQAVGNVGCGRRKTVETRQRKTLPRPCMGQHAGCWRTGMTDSAG